jgi:hypothetical protein
MHQKENNRRGIFRKNIKSKRNYIILKNAREEKKNKKALKKRRNQERDATIERESEERRRKEIRRSQNSIGSIPPDEIKSEVR